MPELPLSFLTQNLYQNFFGFLDRYDCANLLTVNKAIAEDITKYSEVTPFPDSLYYEEDGLGYLTINNSVTHMKPYTSIKLETMEVGFTFTKKVNTLYFINLYDHPLSPYIRIDTRNKKEADNIIYDFTAFKKHQESCKKCARA